MRTEVIHFGKSRAPNAGPKDDVAITFDDVRGFSYDDEGKVYLSPKIDPKTWNGRRHPVNLAAYAYAGLGPEATVEDARAANAIASGLVEVSGPGVLAIGLSGLEADTEYTFLIVANYVR